VQIGYCWSWETQSEVNNPGFNVLRNKSAQAEFVKCDNTLIPSAGDLSEARGYSFTGVEASAGKAYCYKLEHVDFNGTHTEHGRISIFISSQEGQISEKFALLQNYPNPFNPETTIQSDLPRSEYVKTGIVNLLGEKVRSLVDEKQLAGQYSVIWDGQLNSRKQATTGVFICGLQAGDFIAIKNLFWCDKN